MLQCILSLLIFVVNNRVQFLISPEIHNMNTRHNSSLHLPVANLDIYQKGVYYSGIKIFNSLHFNIKTFFDTQGHLKVLYNISLI
jgi:hypothetical protein